ncbi:MAG TPA: HEAT repeat domain-containing protein, partial [Methylomirabilota bacterium]|nr:HEAT repeat domain-containing protein [Methylomirabilota bacterium]
MSHTFQRLLVAVSLLSLFTFLSPVLAAEKTEDQLIADLDSPQVKVVNGALLKLEKLHPTSTKAFPKMKKLLADSRPEVRRKAGRVFGALHADLDKEDIKLIAAMLRAPDAQEQMDALKSLRGLKAPETVPDILPLLKSPAPNIVRDACRTLAVLGNKDTIP